MNKEDKKCFQWAVTATLDNEQIKEEPQRIKKIKTVKIYMTWKEKVTHLRKMIGKKLRKIIK